jgi:acyl-CoA synthetase (NDP forming)
MSSDPARLEAFFTPSRIAVVGASEQGMYPAGVIQNLIQYQFPGEIYPVNPNRKTVFGLPCYADLTSTPVPADLAILVVNRNLVMPALQQCLQAGIYSALIFTAGFSEADEQGRKLQAEMAELVKATPIKILGPNCAGLANVPGHVIATRLPVAPRPGYISLVSQSGALMMALYGLFADRHLGMNRLLSVGNQVDISLSDGLRHLAAHSQTNVIAAFVEGLSDGPVFAAGLQESLAAGKPVVLVKSGRTSAGQKAAATHTAAIAGSDQVFQGVCRQFGAVLVNDLRELMDTIQILDSFGNRIEQGRLAVISTSGGMASLTADWCERAGLKLPPPGEWLQKQLDAIPHLRDIGNLSNPADIRGPSMRGPATEETLTPFLADPETDALLLLLARSAVQEHDAETAEYILRAKRKVDKPLGVVWVGQRYPAERVEFPLGHRMLVEAGIPLFEQASDAVRAFQKARDYWAFRAGWAAQSSGPSGMAVLHD